MRQFVSRKFCGSMTRMVSVLLSTQSHFPVNRKRIRKTVSDALKSVVKRQAEVSVTIVGDRRMKTLNRTFRNKDYPTDVLSFPLNETRDVSVPFVEMPDDVLRLGDIVISYPQAVNAARKTNRLVDEVIDELVLHGLNHLMGIHHDE